MMDHESSTRRRTNGWLLHPLQRNELLKLYAPRYQDVVAHHVTLSSSFDKVDVPAPTRGTIIGRVDDDNGVEALIVEIAGSTNRPDGGTYHITWSLDRSRNREPKDSNDAIARCGWQRLAQTHEIELMPAYWERESTSAT